MKQFTIGAAEKELRLDQYLLRLMPGAGKSFLYKMLRKKNITRNGKKADGNERLNQGDIICIYFSDETYEKFRSGSDAEKTTSKSTTNSNANRMQNLRIPVIYEDDDILIANKPAGVLSQKAEATDYSLNDWFLDYLKQQTVAENTLKADNGASLNFTPSVANRLDRNTSGLILCGKSLVGLRYLAEVLRDRSLHKYYLAVVNGHVSKEQEIEGYLYKDEKTNKVTVTQSDTQGDYICTAYRPLFYQKEQDVTLIEVLLKTGKTHQIRAHLASIGHGLVGDPKYGNRRKNESFRQQFGIKRQLLHCYKLAFAQQKESGILVCGRTFTCAPPNDFTKITGEIYGNLEFPRS